MSTMLSEFSRKRSLAQRIGLDGDETRAATWLRVFLAFLKEAPGVGWTLKGAEAALDELADEADDAKLLERFDELLRVGSQTNEAVAFLTELSKAIFVQNTAVLQRLEQKGLLTEPEQVTALAKEMALVAYRNKVAAEFRDADHRGVEGASRAQRRHATSLPLEDVYVLPRLVPERERVPRVERENELLRALIELRDAADPALVTEYAVLSGERWKLGAKQEEQDRTLSLGRALADARHVVVIGGPGVGKTVLTRYLARICALGVELMQERLEWSEDLVPVRLPLAAFAEARRSKPDLSLRAFLNETMEERGGPALREAVAEQLTAGRVLVLLDGVDEVSESAARAAVVQAVDRFLLDHDAVRVIVTSRPYGYIPLAGDLPHFTLPNFSPEQVTEFVQKWQRACEIKQHPDAPDLKRAEEEATSLLKEIRQNPRVAELSSNPLMLVIVSFIRLERARLPEQRVQLYNAAVNTLMDTWNQWRSQLGVEAGGATLPLDRLVRVWGAVAEWMRRTRNTGVAHRTELERMLVKVLRDREYDEDDPEATAKAYLQAVAGRAGLLEERGPEIFAFWHPTFEEFLAAVELATPAANAANKLLPLADDPRWREVILLAIGYVGIIQRDGETATEIVRRVMDDNAVLEPLMHPRLRLAAAAVADNVGVRRSLVEQVIIRFANVLQHQPYEQLEEVFITTVRTHRALKPSLETVKAIVPLADYPRWEMRMEAARLCSNVAAENRQAHSLCEKLLCDPRMEVRGYAALGLARAGETSIAVLEELPHACGVFAQAKGELLSLLQSNKTLRKELLDKVTVEGFKGLHMQSLVKVLAVGDEAVVHALKSHVVGNDQALRLWAARLLVQLELVDDSVIETIKSELSAENPSVRLESAGLLVRLKLFKETVVEVLKTIAMTADETPILRAAAAMLLVDLGLQVGEDILVMLLEVEDLVSISMAAGMLVGLKRIDIAVEGLRAKVADRNSKIRFDVAALITQLQLSGTVIHQVDEVVIDVLKAQLQADDPEQCCEAAALLVRLERADESVLDTLMANLTADDLAVRYRAAESLVRLQRVEEAIDALESVFAAEDEDMNSEMVNLLQRLRFCEQLLEPLVKCVMAKPFPALAAWQHLLEGHALSSEDATALAETTAIASDDTIGQRTLKGVLFRWLWEKSDRKV